MSTPVFDPNESGKTKRMNAVNMDQTISSKLPHVKREPVEKPSTPIPPVIPAPAVSAPPPPEPQPRVLRSAPTPVSDSSEPKPARQWPRLKLLPAFWTVASIMSMVVNVILIIALLLMLQIYKRVMALEPVQRLQSAQVIQDADPRAMLSDVLGGLYINFVKMDQANIRTNIHVEKEIPVQFSLNVSGPTNVTLSQPVTIRGATVFVQTGGLNIRDANATIVLPQGVVLPINIENLVVPVDQKVMAVLDVPVDIPLDQTELHDPFVGLQKVVEPWYCLIDPQATFNGFQVCSPVTDPTLVDPSLRNPAP